MPAGLSVFLNDGGTIQVDDTFVNLGLVSKHTVVCSTRPDGWYFPHGYLTVQGVTPLVAVKTPSSVRFALYACSVSGSSHTFNFVTEANTTLEVYVFDIPTSVGTFGLQTFKEDGTLCFDSSRKYLRVVSSLEYSNYNQLLNNPPLIPGGDTALLVNRFTGMAFAEPYGGEDGGPSFTQVFINLLFYRIDQNTISANYREVFSSGGGGGFGQWFHETAAVSLQVVDVTNY